MFSPLGQFELFPVLYSGFCSGSMFIWTVGTLSLLCILFCFCFWSHVFFFNFSFFGTFLRSLSFNLCYVRLYSFIMPLLGFLLSYYFGLVSGLFVGIALSNLFGLVPFGFTLTSHFSGVIFISFLFWCGISFRGFFKYGFVFLGLFFPHSPVIWLVPFLVLIECVSYFFRVISLAVRLCANMIAGHTLLKIIFSCCFGVFVVLFLFPIPVFAAGVELDSDLNPPTKSSAKKRSAVGLSFYSLLDMWELCMSWVCLYLFLYFFCSAFLDNWKRYSFLSFGSRLHKSLYLAFCHVFFVLYWPVFEYYVLLFTRAPVVLLLVFLGALVTAVFCSWPPVRAVSLIHVCMVLYKRLNFWWPQRLQSSPLFFLFWCFIFPVGIVFLLCVFTG